MVHRALARAITSTALKHGKPKSGTLRVCPSKLGNLSYTLKPKHKIMKLSIFYLCGTTFIISFLNTIVLALIKSISGIRGTIGGRSGENLTPDEIIQSTAAYGTWLMENNYPLKVVIGRDARISGPLVSQLVSSTLQSLGIHTIDLGLSTTPTVEMAVTALEAGGGIILTASHNPRQWNALKLLNQDGEFISAADGARLLELLHEGQIEYATVDQLGVYERNDQMLDYHVQQVLNHPLVDAALVREKGYAVVVDAVNSTGAIAIPLLLEALGCQCRVLNGEVNGEFAHNPEPLPHHLQDLCLAVARHKADLGVAVDPDVDRLASIGPEGQWIG